MVDKSREEIRKKKIGAGVRRYPTQWAIMRDPGWIVVCAGMHWRRYKVYVPGQGRWWTNIGSMSVLIVRFGMEKIIQCDRNLHIQCDWVNIALRRFLHNHGNVATEGSPKPGLCPTLISNYYNSSLWCTVPLSALFTPCLWTAWTSSH